MLVGWYVSWKSGIYLDLVMLKLIGDRYIIMYECWCGWLNMEYVVMT